MHNLSRILPTEQDLYDLVDAADQMSPDHVTGESKGERKLDVARLCRNLLYVKLMHDPKSVDEWVSMTEAYYASIRNAAEDFDDEWSEHRLTAADYGLSHRVA